MQAEVQELQRQVRRAALRDDEDFQQALECVFDGEISCFSESLSSYRGSEGLDTSGHYINELGKAGIFEEPKAVEENKAD